VSITDLSDLTIRTFAANDAQRLTTLLHEAYAELARLGLNFTAVDQDAETTVRRATVGSCWVAQTQDGRLVGTITMSIPPSEEIQRLTGKARGPGTAWLNQLAVAPHVRGQGLARRLWDIGRTWSLDQGVTRIGLDTAAPAHHLIAMYERWGFKACDLVRWSGKTYDSMVMLAEPSLPKPDQSPSPRWPASSNRELWERARQAQAVAATERQVGRIVCCRQITYEVGDEVPLDGIVWNVLGIFEPLNPRDPWTVSLVARSGDRPVFRSPSVCVAQREVLRVYDGLSFE
jgi:GNAT superfamily N-acetyltransferase